MEDFDKLVFEIYQELSNVKQVKKCAACECFLDVLENINSDLESVGHKETQLIQKEMRQWLNDGNKERHSCYGCEICLPIRPYNRFSARLKGISTSKKTNDALKEPIARDNFGAFNPLNLQFKEVSKWPIIEGDYTVGKTNSSVAICTLADTDLPNELKVAGLLKHVAIIGTLTTENLGIERVIKNLISNPNIKHLVLCGKDSRGHKAGQALISLKENGLDQDNRIIGSVGPRPVLKNITHDEVEIFRNRIDIIDEIGTLEINKLTEIVQSYSSTQKSNALSFSSNVVSPKVIVAKTRNNREWIHDPEGFFLVLIDRDAKIIVCEYYSQEGVLSEIIRGENAEDISNTIIKRGCLSRLDHAAYLGRELAKAETALNLSVPYKQDEPLFKDKGITQ